MCRLFSRADSYVADPHVVSGSLKKITAQKTIYRFDDFDEKPGYTMSVVDGIFGDEKLKEEMATGLYHDVRPFPGVAWIPRLTLLLVLALTSD